MDKLMTDESKPIALSGAFITSHAQQQQYSANSVMQCNNSDKTGPSPSFLYTCNNKIPSCQAFLMFKTKPPYISVPSISNLTSSDPSELSRINNISISTVLPTDTAVIIPVTCSCSDKYYQANTSYISRPVDNTYFTIANNTYQGLTTCNALKRENRYGEFDLFPGLKLQVPLRCACPTEKQAANGTKFLLTFLVTWNDTVPKISDKFNVSAESVAIANGFSNEDPILYPFTTILIPLSTEPLFFQTTSISYPNIQPRKKHKTSYKGLYVGIGIDVANGLDYLHNFTFPAYVHKNISSRNILLNRDLRAKIANFSLARENGNTNTSRVVGEKGYMAPEYIQDGKVTPKIDVYALGVILLELITGREAVLFRGGEEVLLSETVVSAMDGTEIAELIDPRLQVMHPLGYIIDHTELALRLLKLSVACLAKEPVNRLSMAEVVSALMKIQLDVYNSQNLYTE
ncbi:hypothetical protein DH2020_037371 [Rehmannia glutinosa]|uniref:Protein kinase domain-containing protein n=1 Tax=Rehmannia glutinosa TaxID=99300 RepID=A0ABR0V4A0_REHGL